ncbi:choline dehydrogenase-like flavoprotein [Altererythrobacter atlanticus]|uniref:Alcohol dehydrogenase n=1 Tax=Croceibacterium atlanticum TaxID=1267766 RepID=A0A0F7KVH8_9SPHN|nr:GMC family oxidoreductase N-terminal domain-containing protein [Croceibacterium atlanticum]AKH43181.1 Alcohol dehydrogenase [Croceibacterium atlanticum]MBB5732114.1 choline dehydrogenase-like flavoprotein [Croceibacterium atlanticum]
MSAAEFDYVVVGAGSAGAALAARLGEAADRTTCVIEAGGRDTHPFIRIPSFVAAAIARKRTNWGFATVPQTGMAGRRIGVPRGKVLGGSGSINGMVYFRGHPTDYDDWADAGCTGWSYAEVLPYFTRTERNEDYPESVFHGTHGPINVKLVENPNRLNFAFMDALESLQFPACPDFNGPDPEGYGRRQGLIRDGRRESTSRNMLRPAMARGNVHVQTGAQVARVLVENGRAIGVELTDGRRIRARREVILSAGTVQTPQILMLSGIGPGSHLQDMGIKVVADRRGVGANYHDHVAAPIHMETRDPTSYGISPRALPRDIGHLFRYLFTRKGPLAGNVFESVAFLRTDPDLERPDVQFVFQPARRLTTRIPFPVGHGFAISPVALYPKSRGTVRLANPEPETAPLIDPKLLHEPEDILPLIRALKIARQVFASAAFAPYRASEVAPGPEMRSDAELDRYIRETGYTVHHPVGTCRMGSDAGAVVDPQLRVNGVEGLRVVDASVMPGVIGGNTNAPCVMIAERAADFILGKPPLPAADLPPESVARHKPAKQKAA